MHSAAKAAARMVEIGEDSAGQRLDNYLAKVLKGAPRSLIHRIIRSGEVRVNKGRAAADTRLELEDCVRIPPLSLAAADSGVPAVAATRAGQALPVIMEDESLLAIDKPAGIAVHGGSGLSFGVIEALRAARPGARFLELVHRLDRETSGVLLLAKKRAVLVAMHALLREGRTDKRYLALVKGVWPHESKFHIRTALSSFVTRDGERRVVADDEDAAAREAHSVVTVSRRFADATLLEVALKTGRTHQIRVHLADQGHPILGDSKYGDFALNRSLAREGLTRMFLHAARLSFVHPESGARMRIEAPLPPACRDFLASLAPFRNPA